MLRFLIDESSGKKLAGFLKEKGFDAVYVGDWLKGADDEAILQKSNQEDRILITNDSDFGELIFRWKKPSSGIIFLRLMTDNPSNRLKVALFLIQTLNKKLKKRFIVASENKVRIRDM